MKTSNPLILDGYDASTSFLTYPVWIENMIGFSVTANFVGGSPAGTILIQVSNDAHDPAVWSDLTAPVDSTKTISGASINTWNVSNQFARWFRLKYTRSSGSSTVTIRANLKGV